MRFRKPAIALGALLLAGMAHAPVAGAAPVTTHPRLWITQADLPRLRDWADPGKTDNPMFTKGLLPALQFALNVYDTKFFPGGQPNPNWTAAVDGGTFDFSAYPAEAYAEFFAFMSLIDPDPNARVRHAQRARNLLMAIIDEAAKGHAAGLPYRDPIFATFNRSRWWGEAFGLTVDWIYDAVDGQGHRILSDADKAVIRKVFLMWADDNLHGYMAPPQLGNNDPGLLNGGARGSANNYYSGHMRNLTLLSLALDPADDPPLDAGQPANQLGNTLRSYIDNVTGTWLYRQYALYERPDIVRQAYGLPAADLPKLGNASGGLPAEGFLYGSSLGYVTEALLALRTAGHEDPGLAGPQAGLGQSGYWDLFLAGFLHSTAPAPALLHPWQGPVYPAAGYGDTLRSYVESDWADLFTSLAAYDRASGNAQRLQADRWIAANVIEGGADRLLSRVAGIWGNGRASTAILHFLAFDPASAQAAAQIPDPRPALPARFYDPALGRLLSRTDWTANATWFDFKCSWIGINHQNADCNQFEFYRNGEWLTKEHTNYDDGAIGKTTDYHNTLSLQNDVPGNLRWYETQTSQRGSQWLEGMAAGDPATLASGGDGYEFAQGDATHLYNRPFQWGKQALDIAHASRSVVWLKPDFIVAYDRATSNTAGRFKRFNLQLVTNPSVLGHLAVETLPSGQKLFVQNLLPANATLTASLDEPINPLAEGEPTRYRLVMEDNSNPNDVRFLNVLQGADANQALQPASHIRSSDGRYEGAVVNNTAVLFQSVLGPAAPAVSYAVPLGVDAHVITGLAPNTGYDLQTQPDPEGTRVTVSAGGGYRTDAAGVLSVNPNALVTGLTPASLSIPAAGGPGGVSVSALAGAAWNAASNVPWITLTGGVSGAGDGRVSYAAAPNPSAGPRTGTIGIGGLSFTLTQKGLVCQPSLSATGASVPATIASGNVNVSVAPGCAWTASSNAPWISVGGSGGSGNGGVAYTVQANSGGARGGSLTIAGQTFTVSQAGASSGGGSGSGGSCGYSLNIARKLMIAGASTKGVVLTTPAGCTWTAGSSAPAWLTASPAGGSGGKVVNFTAAANPGAASRSATLTIGGKALSVVQAGNAGNGCIYAFGSDAQPSFPSSATAAHGGGTGSVPVSAPGGCGWTAASNVPWIAVTSGASVASGGGTVRYSVAPNPGGSRTGTLSIAGLTYTVTQN
jgi:hypothetical protein